MSEPGNSRPRALISDLGGVLTTPLLEAFTAFRDHSGIAFEDFGHALQRAAERHGTHPLFELEMGRLSEAEFLSRLSSELPGTPSLDEFRAVYWDALAPNTALFEYFAAIRERGLRMALLTNNVREWQPIWMAKMPEIKDLFEVIVDSAFVGMRKPDPDIYHLTVERLGDGLGHADCVFLDDIELNVEAARELGMRAVHFRDTEQAIAELEVALGA